MSYKIMMPKNGTGDAMIVMSDGQMVKAAVKTDKQSNWNVIDVVTDLNGKAATKRSVRTGSRLVVSQKLQDEVKAEMAAGKFNQREFAEAVGYGITVADVSSIVSRKTPFNMLSQTVDSVSNYLSGHLRDEL